MAKMNSTSLYVTTNLLVINAKREDPKSWQDLYRLLPYLRNSLCCVVCGNLLVDPLTPKGKCNHHLCRRCKDGRKKIKPACSWCKDSSVYSENKKLRVMLQCYNKMCMFLAKSFIFEELGKQANQQTATGAENLICFIKEGEAFYDAYKSAGGLPKSAYSILPCVYTNSSTQTLTPQTTIPQEAKNLLAITTNTTNSTNSANSTQQALPKSKPYLYSVLYPSGAGNKMTIKRKVKDPLEIVKAAPKEPQTEKSIFKKPTTKCNVKPKRGCRCGNATATPGKLTCCGQRCPCYVDSKACIECKCRGCRNPHRPDGNKVRPHLPEIQRINYVSQQSQQQSPQTKSGDKSEHQLQNVVPIDGMDYTQYSSLELGPVAQRYAKTYKVVTGGYNGLSVSTNILLNGPLLSEDDDDLSVV